MSLRTITAITFLLSVATLSIKATQYPGCVMIAGGTTKCNECYRRKVLPNGEGCGPLLPEADKCQIYLKDPSQAESRCATCKVGYADGSNSKTPSDFCLKGKIKGCVEETLAPSGIRVCYACSGGMYAFDDGSYLCKKIPLPVANCMWGARYQPATGQAECYRCNPGYSLNYNTGKC